MTHQAPGLLAGGFIAALVIMTGPVLAEESASAEIAQRAR